MEAGNAPDARLDFRAKSLLFEALAREIGIAERNVREFACQRCDRIVARVLARLPQARD